MRLAGGIAVTLFLVAVPGFVGFQLTTWTVALTDVMLFLSLGLVVRASGQLSLCQAGFATVGAVAFSKLAVSAHVPWVLALVLAGLVVVPIGALVAIPAIRLAGLYLAIATFGFGILLQQMFYGSSLMFGLGGYAGLPMPRPHLGWLDLASDRGFFYLVLVLTLLAACLRSCSTAAISRAPPRPGALRAGSAGRSSVWTGHAGVLDAVRPGLRRTHLHRLTRRSSQLTHRAGGLPGPARTGTGEDGMKATADPQPAPALELRGIHAGYGKVPILRDVSLTVPPGSIVPLLGANGAGKSTAMRVAAGLLRPSRGDVLISGAILTERPAHQRVRRGL